MNTEQTALFSEAPVRKAVLTLAIPTVISQLITVVYIWRTHFSLEN